MFAMKRLFVCTVVYLFTLSILVSTSADVALVSYSASLSERHKIMSEADSTAQENQSGVSKELFLFIANKFEQIFKPVIDFELEALWDDLGASAFVVPILSEKGKIITVHDKPTIVLQGGVARYETSTPGALMLILCHELGHIATDPRLEHPIDNLDNLYSGEFEDAVVEFFTGELEADYWATSYCMKKVYESLSENEKEILNISTEPLPGRDENEHSHVLERCSEVYSDDQDVDMCVSLSTISTQATTLTSSMMSKPPSGSMMLYEPFLKSEYIKNTLLYSIENDYNDAGREDAGDITGVCYTLTDDGAHEVECTESIEEGSSYTVNLISNIGFEDPENIRYFLPNNLWDRLTLEYYTTLGIAGTPSEDWYASGQIKSYEFQSFVLEELENMTEEGLKEVLIQGYQNMSSEEIKQNELVRLDIRSNNMELENDYYDSTEDHSLSGEMEVPMINTPDTSAFNVNKIYDYVFGEEPHHLQCRLDTLFQGVLCDPSKLESDDGISGCTRDQGFDLGVRPSCWYKAP